MRRRVREDSERNLFVGVAHPGGERVLELVVSADAVGRHQTPKSLVALKTVQEPGTAGDKSRFVSFSLLPRWQSVFTPFCNDVIESGRCGRR